MHVCFFHLHIFLRKFPFPLFSITVCGAHPSLDLVKEPPVTLRSKIVLSFLPPFHSAPFSLFFFFLTVAHVLHLPWRMLLAPVPNLERGLAVVQKHQVSSRRPRHHFTLWCRQESVHSFFKPSNSELHWGTRSQSSSVETSPHRISSHQHCNLNYDWTKRLEFFYWFSVPAGRCRAHGWTKKQLKSVPGWY